MSGQIITKWHHFLSAAAAGNIGVVAEPYTAYKLGDIKGIDKKAAADWLQWLSGMPRFCIDDTLLKLVMQKDSLQSVSDMIDCGELSLPFDNVVVEYQNGDTRYFVSLSYSPSDKYGFLKWIVTVAAVYMKDGKPQAMIYPQTMHVGLHKGAKPVFDSKDNYEDLSKEILGSDSWGVDGEDGIGYSFTIVQMPYLDGCDPDMASKWCKDSTGQAVNRAIVALQAMLILPSAIGIDKEKHAIKESMNKARVAGGKPRIPSYTYIRLGSYQIAPGGPLKPHVPGASPEVHIRRAHKRRIVFGVGRTERKWQFFPAQVVGYLPDGRKPELTEMLATRAMRPYVVR